MLLQVKSKPKGKVVKEILCCCFVIVFDCVLIYKIFFIIQLLCDT